MASAPAPAHAAQLTLRFADAAALGAALRRHPGQAATGALCIQVVKHYELGDVVQVTLEAAAERFVIHGAVTWRRPGYIGVRLQPASAAENQSFTRLKSYLGSPARAAPADATAPQTHTPFSE